MKPDLDAIRARLWSASTPAYTFADDVAKLLRYINELERNLLNERAAFESCNRARRHCEDECASLRARACITNDAGAASLINTLEHMLAEDRENVDTLRARVAELEAEVATLCQRDALLKRVDDALTEAGCVQPLSFDGTIESAIKDLARRATRAEQLFVDEYDARKAAEREIAELKARIVVLEAMKP